MDTQDIKEAGFTPMQSMQLKIDKLSLSIDWLKWNLAIGFSVLFAGLIGLASLVFFLFARLETNTRQDIQRLESGIQENRKLLIELIQKQAPTNTGPARYKAKPDKKTS